MDFKTLRFLKPLNKTLDVESNLKNNIVVMILGVLLVCFGLLVGYIPILSFFPANICFWIGFLAILGSTKFSKNKIIWWASFTILAQILLFIINFFIFQFCIFLSNADAPMFIQLTFFKINDLLRFIISPVKHFFPYPKEILPGGGVQITVYPLRENIINFFDVIVYILIGVLIGYIRTKVSSKKMN